MSSTPRDPQRKLLSLQRRIFMALKEDSELLLGETPEEIRRYEREFEADFKGVSRLNARPKSELVREMRRHDVTLIADFHTFSQAQRTALRLIREAVGEAPGPQRWALGLELIPSQFQPELDAFQRRELGLEEFHERIRYAEEWGFEWRNYAPLFDWARGAGVALVALNRPRELVGALRGALPRPRGGYAGGPGADAGFNDLHERDLWAAGIITDLFHRAEREREKLRMIVLYGELHVASAHLPERIRAVSAPILKRPLEPLVVHQNHDSLYWRLARLGRERETDALKLRRGVYCVISSPPWAKLQSLVSWAESDGAGSFASARDEDDEAHEPDYLSMMRNFGESLSEFVGIPSPDFGSLTLRTIAEADFVGELESSGRFSPQELGFLRAQVAANRRILIPRVNIAYLGTPSVNGTAELAAAYLQRHRTRSQALFERDPDDFFRLVIEAAFSFFGSLVVNPRRKCDLPADHERRIAQLLSPEAGSSEIRGETRGETRGGARAGARAEAEARKLVLALAEWSESPARGRARRRHPSQLRRAMSSFRKAPTTLLAAEFLGQILGKKLHGAVVDGQLGTETVRYLCLARADGEHRPFEHRYLELVEAVAESRIAPSKTDML